MARKGREIAFLLTMLMLILHLPSASAQVLAPQLRGLFALSKAADDTHSNIFIVRPDGSQVGQLTALTGENTEPAWSTDGKMIAFTHQEGDETRIFIARLDNSAPYPLFDWQASAPSWNSNRRILALSAAIRSALSQIYTVNLDGTHLKQLSQGDCDNSSPAWSPDGRLIAYISQPSQSENGLDAYAPQLYVMNEDGSRAHDLTQEVTGVTSPQWSPDSKRIAYIAHGIDSTEIAVVDIDFAAPQYLMDFSAMDENGNPTPQPVALAWTADGRFILYAAGESVSAIPSVAQNDSPGSTQSLLIFNEDSPILDMAWFSSN